MNDGLKISLLTVLIIVSRFVLQVDYNEMDVLPSAYSVYNPNWLAGDWYLSLDVPYRALFGYLVGFFIDLAGFIPVLLIGRIFTYALFSYAYLKLVQSIGVNFFLGAIVLVLFLSVFTEGAFYGEWMVGGLETKVFSYVFILLSISTFLNNDIGKSMFFAGLALSFHLLIGGYFAICLSVVFLVQRQSELSHIIRKSYWYLIGGIWGLYGIYGHLTNTLDSNTGWEIYTQLRVAYHVLPKLSTVPIIALTVFTLFNLAVIKYSNNRKLETLAIVALTSCSISIAGYLIYFVGATDLLRFYFFRLNDALTPLLSLMILVSYVSNRIWNASNKLLEKSVSIAFSIGIIAFTLLYFDNVKRIFNPSNYSRETILRTSVIDFKMTNWIKENTAKESVFIVPISMSNFYMEAERSMFVSWKHLPQSAHEIEEWYKRLKFLNRGDELEQSGSFYPQNFESNYSKLSEQELDEIKSVYPELTYIVMPIESDLMLNVAFESEQFRLYELE